MFCTLIATALVLPPRSLNILFLGNSHTSVNDVPGMVKSLIESDGSGTKVSFKIHWAGFVEELATNQALRTDIQSGKWNTVVLQGAKLSSSHRYEYDHSGAVQIAKMAKAKGMKAFLFAEWPRRGWNETSYIIKEYKEIADPSGAVIVPIPHAWDSLLKEHPNAPVWAGDGNHAQLAGSYLAAYTIASWMGSKGSSWQPNGIDPKLGSAIRRIVKQTAAKHR